MNPSLNKIHTELTIRIKHWFNNHPVEYDIFYYLGIIFMKIFILKRATVYETDFYKYTRE